MYGRIYKQRIMLQRNGKNQLKTIEGEKSVSIFVRINFIKRCNCCLFYALSAHWLIVL